MSHPHPPSDPAGYSGGPPSGSVPAYSAPYLGTYAPPTQQRARWPLILIAVALAIALIAVIVKVALHSEPDLSAPPSTSTLPAAPPMIVPEGSVPATGPGWIMEISPEWPDVRTPPKAKADAAWATGGGTRGFGNNIVVLHESVPASVQLERYLTVSAERLPKLVPSAHVVSRHAYAAPGREYGRIEYTATLDGRRVHNVAYLARIGDGFVVATYSSLPKLFSVYAPKVEPYLASLRGH
jgi:hypothetical protein